MITRIPAVLFCLLCASLCLGQSRITGTLLGQDGKPLSFADVHLRNGMNDTALASARVAPDGAYSITVPAAGAYYVEYSAADHSSHQVPLISRGEAETKINVRLGAYSLQDELGGVQFVQLKPDLSPGETYTPRKQTDGTYVAEIKTDQPLFKYEVNGVEKTGRTINGTMSDTFEYDGGGDYCSVVTPHNGSVRIVFDPAKLVRGRVESSVEFPGKESGAARLPGIMEALNKRQQEYATAYADYRAKNKDAHGFTYDWEPAAAEVQKQIAAEKDPLVREELWMERLGYLYMGGKAADRRVKDQALGEISPGSPLWVFHLNVLNMLMYDTTGGDVFAEKVLTAQQDPGVKGTMLISKLSYARYVGKKEEARTLYNRLVKECDGTRWAKMARERYSRDMSVFDGSKAPAFSFVSLEDSTKTFTNETFKGKYLLIDFWAVWCGPCVAEMENLHKAYERFKGADFAVLSLSFDGSPADVKKFRDTRWKMPWNHAFVPQGFANPVSKAFEVEGIPKPMLVDPNGTIVAMTVELRGTNLEQTLEKYLGHRP